MPISFIIIFCLGSLDKLQLRFARELKLSSDITVLRRNASNELPQYSDSSFFSIEDGLKVLQIIEAARKSSISGGQASKLAFLQTSKGVL